MVTRNVLRSLSEYRNPAFGAMGRVGPFAFVEAETEAAPAACFTTGATFSAVPEDFVDFFVTSLPFAALAVAVVFFSKLRFDVADETSADEVNFTDVFGLEAVLGGCLSWLFFLLQPYDRLF